MKKVALILVSLAGLYSLIAPPAIADDLKEVSATVSPIVISISVNPASVDYGTQELGVTNVTPDPNKFVVTNTGNVMVDLFIRGSDTENWQLGAAQGHNTFVHRYSTGGGSFATLTKTPVSLFNDVSPNGTIDVFLNMDLPTTSGSTNTQMTKVTVTATQAQ